MIVKITVFRDMTLCSAHKAIVLILKLTTDLNSHLFCHRALCVNENDWTGYVACLIEINMLEKFSLEISFKQATWKICTCLDLQCSNLF